MPSIQRQSRSLRKARSQPVLRVLAGSMPGDSSLFGLGESTPGIVHPAFVNKDPCHLGLLSPVSPMFDLELESSKASRNAGLLEKCQSELSLAKVGKKECSQLEQLLGLFRNTCPVSVQLCKLLYQHRSAQLSAMGANSMHHPYSQEVCMDIEAIARELLAAGYLVQVRDEAQQERPKDVRTCLQNLRHRFLVCLGYRPMGEGEPMYLPEPVVVEPRFREQFAIAHPTAAYEATLQAVPPCFVGPVYRLEAVVKLLCQEMTQAFKTQSLPVPPWRTRQAMLSKWAPAQLAQLAEKMAMMRRMSADLGHSGAPVGSSSHGDLCNGARPAAALVSHAAVGSAPSCTQNGGTATTVSCIQVSSSGGVAPQHQERQQLAGMPFGREVAARAPFASLASARAAAIAAGSSAVCCAGASSKVRAALPINACAGPAPSGPVMMAAVPEQVQLASPFAGVPGEGLPLFGSEVDSPGLMGSALRFTRKASAEWKQRKEGKKKKGLLAVALNRAAAAGPKVEPGSTETQQRNKHIRVSGDEPWSRITTVRWGAAYTGPVTRSN